MNEKKPRVETTTMMELLFDDNLCDDEYCRFHCAVLELVSARIKAEKVSPPPDLYCRYKGYIKIVTRVYKLIESIQKENLIGISPAVLLEMYSDYREQIGINYRMLCHWFIFSYEQTTFSEGREALGEIIYAINRIIKQIKPES